MTTRHIHQPHGAYVHTYSPAHPPVAEVTPGEPVIVHTVDAFGNRLTSAEDLPSHGRGYPYVNPQTGPILVSGSEPGDILRVYIRDIALARDYAVTCLIPHFGALQTSENTPMLHQPFPEQTKMLPVRDDRLWFSDELSFPLHPFIGSLGVAPEIEALSSLIPGAHGGNLDSPETRAGVEIQFPVFVDGAQFFIGDGHAAQGDGELSGVAAEIPLQVTLEFGLVKQAPLAGPRIISDSYLIALGWGKPLEDAVRMASTRMVHWLAESSSLCIPDAYMLIGQCLDLRIGNVVDPNYTVMARFHRNLLPRDHSLAV